MQKDWLELLDRLLVPGGEAFARDVPAGAVAGLTADGCVFGGSGASGLRLVEAGLGVWGAYLRWKLGAGAGGPASRVEVYRSVSSTQDAARRLIAAQGAAAAGSVVVADEQTAGRGRLGRPWVADAGAAALLSVVLPVRGGDAGRLTLVGGAAAAEVAAGWLAGAGGVARPVIKWPNDVLVDGAKLAGVLVETEATGGPTGDGARLAVVGVGLNVGAMSGAAGSAGARVAAGGGRAVGLAGLGVRVDRLAVVAALAGRVLALAGDAGAALAAWRGYWVPSAVPGVWRCGGREVRGEAVDVDPDAGLIVRTTDGGLTHLPAATTTTVR